MKTLSLAEINSLRKTAGETFLDSCTLDRVVTSGNSYGEIIQSWVSDSEIQCGLEMTGGIEKVSGEVIVVERDAVIRLPLNTLIDIRDRITLTKKYGITVSGIQFEIISLPKIGASAMRLDLKKVEV